jgi:hypothetical protein
MRDCASTWPRLKTKTLEDKSTCSEKSWPVPTTSALDITNKLRKAERRLKMRTKITKLFQKSQKRQITRSSPFRPSMRRKKRISKYRSISFKWNSRIKTTFWRSKNKRPKRPKRARKLVKPLSLTPSLFWRDVWIKSLKPTRKRESWWTST